MLGFFLRFLRLHRGLVSTCSRGDREKGTKPKERNGMGKIEGWVKIRMEDLLLDIVDKIWRVNINTFIHFIIHKRLFAFP